MTHRPVTLAQANEIVARYHRHNRPVVGHRFSIAAYEGEEIVGVAIVGRPVARKSDQYRDAEILRVCVTPTAPRNTNSYLYGACRRIWQTMGGRSIFTFTLGTESGASLRGAGYKVVAELHHRNSWNSPTRRRQPGTVDGQMKLKWEGASGASPAPREK